MAERRYYVYVMTNRNGQVMYVGVTNDLVRRVWQHRQRSMAGFTAKYHVTRLVYFEECTDVFAAIAREKQIKAWRRERKNALVRGSNPELADIAADWFAH